VDKPGLPIPATIALFAGTRSLGRERRGWHLLPYSNVPGGDADKLASAVARWGGTAQQESCQTSEGVISAGEHPQVAPRIEIVFDRQQENVRGASALAELGAIRVLFPAHVPQQGAIGGTECDEIAPASVIRTENELAGFQLRESPLDVESTEGRAIAPDSHHLVITELRNRFDCVLETGGKAPAGLPMDGQTSNRRAGA
jgi:hypothetical protein